MARGVNQANGTTPVGSLRGLSPSQVHDALSEVSCRDIRCGYGDWVPSFLQRFTKKGWYLLMYCLVGTSLGSFFTYTVAILSTLEKRFNLTSTQSGIMLGGNDISQALFAIFVAYYGNLGHRPRWMAFGALLAAVSCLFAITPHLIYGPGTDEAFTQQLLATANHTAEDLCPHTGRSTAPIMALETTIPLLIFFAAQFILGIAVSTFFSLGLVYLDDNIDPNESPFYYGISLVVRVMGPAFGFILGSGSLRRWIDPSQIPPISQTDSRWLGAWWSGYAFLTVLLIVLGVLMFAYPRELPVILGQKVVELEEKTSSENIENRSLQYLVDQVKQNEHHEFACYKKIPKALLRLTKNKIWLGATINNVLFLLAFSGYMSFKPKFLETQFAKTASQANIASGLSGLLSSIVGFMVGGIVVRYKQPGPRLISAYNVAVSLLAGLAFVALIFVGCPKHEIIGLDSPCSEECNCTNKFNPICTDTGYTYYSPCHAGCQSALQDGKIKNYSDCRCAHLRDDIKLVNIENSTTEYGFGNGTARSGYCSVDCQNFLPYILIETLSQLLVALGKVGGTLIFLRSMHDQEKALAIGAITVLVSVFSFIPGPIIMGAIVDSTCLIWNESGGGKGNCWFYDTDNQRIVMHAFAAVLILLSTIGDTLVWMNCKGMRLYGKNTENIEMRGKEKY